MTLVVSFEKPSGCFELAVVSNAGKDVQNFALGGARVTGAVRCKKRQIQRFSKPNRCLVATLFDRIAVPLDFDIDILFSEDSRQLFNILARFVVTFIGKRSRQHAFFAARQTHQSLGMFCYFLQCCRSSSFFLLTQLVARHEAAQVLIPSPAFHEQRQSYWSRRKTIRHPGRQAGPVSKTFYGNLGSDVRANADGLCRHVESRRTVNTVTINQGDGRQIEFLRARYQVFRTRSPFEKTECGRRMQLDELQS